MAISPAGPVPHQPLGRAISIAPSIHGVIALDDATKITKPSATDTGFTIWGGFTFSWSKAFGGAAEE